MPDLVTTVHFLFTGLYCFFVWAIFLSIPPIFCDTDYDLLKTNEFSTDMTTN